MYVIQRHVFLAELDSSYGICLVFCVLVALSTAQYKQIWGSLEFVIEKPMKKPFVLLLLMHLPVKLSLFRRKFHQKR